MQLNETEMHVLQGAVPTTQTPFLAFQLPTINAAVPRFVEIVERDVDFTPLARALLDAGVIDPEAIDLNASTPRCILEQGLCAWFKERTRSMRHLKFEVGVLDPVAANDYINEPYSDSEPKEFTNWAIALEGYPTSEVRCAEPIALELEKKCPNLFYTAFSTMERAGWRTAEVLTPINVLEQTASFMLWDGDFSEIPSDSDALEYLVDRYGEEAERYLPSTLLRVWGQGFVFPRKGQTPIGKRKLKQLSRSKDAQVATVARQVLKLQEAMKYAEECGAKMPWHEGVPQPIHTACSVGFNRDDRYTEFIDMQVNSLHESGDYTELLAIGQLPEDTLELDSYFIKLDALFRLMTELDATIPLLSTGDGAE